MPYLDSWEPLGQIQQGRLSPPALLEVNNQSTMQCCCVCIFGMRTFLGTRASCLLCVDLSEIPVALCKSRAPAPVSVAGVSPRSSVVQHALCGHHHPPQQTGCIPLVPSQLYQSCPGGFLSHRCLIRVMYCEGWHCGSASRTDAPPFPSVFPLGSSWI